MKKIKHREIYLIIAILTIALLLLLANQIIFRKPASKLQVSVNGQITEIFDLSQDVDTVLTGANGGTNHLIIEDGQAYVTEASCPDKICVKKGRISHTGESIVCLPNKMIATVIGGGDD